MTIVVSADPAQRAAKSDFAKQKFTHAYMDCPHCGKRYKTHFKYFACFECSSTYRAEKKAEKESGALDAARAMLAVERRKAEIKAAQRGKR